MKVIEASLSTQSPFMNDYLNGSQKVENFFDYTYTDEMQFEKRAKELQLRSFQRESLAAYFSAVHERLDFKEEAFAQIAKLKDERSLVVVGGQQAGLLTGPLYTVYKAMSIIHLAKEQEEKLGVPVVPVFWVAGEDHDLDEIRFVYKEKYKRWTKHLFNERADSDSASHVFLDQVQLRKWIKQTFETMPETSYTLELLQKTEQFAEQSITYVDFFMKMMNWFFGHCGLLLLDSHAPALRRIEINYFKEIIEEIEQVQIAQQRGSRAFMEAGYGEPIETDEENAHLFLQVENERIRVDYMNERFVLRGTDLSFTKAELLQLLQEKPELFSNNVVTRPLMQEWLLPVLAFITGPGELRYWATLKPLFEHFSLSVPPVIPRAQVTFVPAHIQKWLQEKGYSAEQLIEGQMEELREKWFSKKNEYEVAETIESTKAQIYEAHKQLRQLAKAIDPVLGLLSEKNAKRINHEVHFLEKKIEQHLRKKHEHQLAKYNEAGFWLHPEKAPQERIIHPLLLLNLIGIDQFREILTDDEAMYTGHKIIYL